MNDNEDQLNKPPAQEEQEVSIGKKHKLSASYSSPVTNNDEFIEEVPLPSVNVGDIEKCLEGRNPPKNQSTARWSETIVAASQTTAPADLFVDSLNNPESTFEQGVQTPSGILTTEQAKFKKISNQTLDGEKAVMLVRNTFGLGSHVRIPLFHSGFWVTIKAPSESSILELHRQITMDKIELGRSSYGLGFSNQNIFFVSRIFELIKSHIHSHSIKTDKDISQFIYAHDIPILVWGLACAIWPNGFKYSRACLSKPDECQHVVTELLNLSKLHWTNTSSLNAWQKNHMLNKNSASMSEDDVIRYRKELLNNQPRMVKIDNNHEEFSITLKTPTVYEWVQQGTKWINNIVEAITSAISTTDSVAERNNLMINSAKSSALRQYSHWVECINIDSNDIKDRESIEETLGALTASDQMRLKIIEAVQKYIEDTVISLIGIPSYECPNCGNIQQQENVSEKFVNIIPLEVYTTFFILIMQRVTKIAMR